MSSGPSAAAAQAAALAALRDFNVEAFTLLAIAVLITGLRSYIRISTVGFKNLWADDYLVIVGAIFHGIETGLAYSVGNIAHGLANNSMPDAHRQALQPSDPEYQTRVLGSKIQLCGWTSYSVLLWTLKAAMCTFYFRLTRDLVGYRPRLYVGFGFIAVSWIAVMLNLLLSCRPFHRMWQIYPNPGLYCQPAISPALVWTYLAFNVATDMYLIAIPMPMLFKAAMPVVQRVWLVCLFSCGLFVTMAAILRVVLLVSDPVNGAQLAGSWAVRETFVAVVTTNIPVLFPHFKKWLHPLASVIGTKLGYSRGSRGESADPTTLDTWRSKSRRSSRRTTSNPLSENDGNESQERMVDVVSLNDLSQKTSLGKISKEEMHVESAELDGTGIQRQVEITITPADGEVKQHKSGKKRRSYTTIWSDHRAEVLEQGDESPARHIRGGPAMASKRASLVARDGQP